MTVVGVRELRQDASRLLREVAAGGTVTVTDRGRPVARLVPIHSGALDQLLAEGNARPPSLDSQGIGFPPPLTEANGPSLTDTLIAMRAEED